MIRRRNNVGLVLLYDNEAELGLKQFLQRFSITESDTQTGSILNIDDREFAPDTSFQHPTEQTRNEILNTSLSSTQQEPSPPLSLLNQSKANTFRGGLSADPIAVDPPSNSLSQLQRPQQETDDGDDELDLFKKTPLAPLQPVYRTALEAGPASALTVVPKDAPSPVFEMKEDRIAAPSEQPQHFLQPDLRASLTTPGTSRDSQRFSNRPEVASSHQAISGAASLDMPNSGTLETSSRQAAFLPAIPISTKKPIVIFANHPSAAPEPDYAFPDPPHLQPTPSLHRAQPQRQHQFHSDFTLPPLKSINPDYKKSRALKRKRDKEREAAGKESRKDDWVPLGLNKWAATVNSNPVWKKVARASKCLTTREWAKWMRVDFREERKWKLALAYNISTDVLDWHAAGTTEVRVAKGISVRWKRARSEEVSQEAAMGDDHFEEPAYHAEMEVDAEENQRQRGVSLLGVDYGSEEEDDDEDEDNDDDADRASQNIADELQPSTLIALALEEADTSTVPQPNNEPVVQPKTEDVEDLSALIKQDPSDDAVIDHMIVDIKPDTTPGLKATSSDPVLASQPTPSSTGGDTDTISAPSSKTGRPNIYAPFREIIAYSEDDKLFLDLEEFNITRLDAGPKIRKEVPLPPGIESIFPDLHIFDFDFNPVVQTIDGKRPERRLDRDDPNKRPDDILYTKLYPTGDFMMSKPTLIGPLHPSRNWKGGQWQTLDDSAVAPDSDNSAARTDDSASDLFDGRSNSGLSLIAIQLQTAFMKDKDIRKRTDHLWSSADDVLLKSLCDRYPNNWALISECFNASRLTISTDKRTPRDCLDRWREKWGPETRRLPDNLLATEATPPPTSTQMTTRGVKRLASASVSSTTPGGLPAGSEPRKKRRHALVLDTIRKAGKKRAETLQKAQLAQRKTPGVHETHAQYSKLPKRTPAELSRVKADKEALQLQEMQQARKRQEEANRNNLHRLTNGQGPPPAPQPALQNQPQPQATPTMQRPAVPPQVPQIRNQVNISQQQRTSTPNMQPGRLTQQQMLQVRVAQQQQQQQHALAHAQNQIQANGVVAVNGSAASATNPHLSPPYVTRDVPNTLSVSPPNNSVVTSAVNSPRPPSAQAQVHPLPLQVAGNAGTRGTYYLPNIPSVQGYTTEQLQTALRLTQRRRFIATSLSPTSVVLVDNSSILTDKTPSLFFPAMASNIQGNISYDPLPLTSDDHPTNALYNAPPSPSSTSFHTPQLNPADLGVDSAGFPLGAAQPRFLGAALYDEAGAPHIRNSYASTHNSGPSGGGSEYTGSVYALNDTLGATPLNHGPYGGGYRDDPRDSLGDLPMSPMGQSQSRFMEEKRAVYAAPRAKSKRNIIILAVLAALILAIIAVVIPVYFAIIKPNSNKSSSDSGSTTAHPTSTGTGKPTVAAVVTGGDGSKVTTGDGSTFTYSNSFGGYWYWDENDPFNNGARAQSWSPALNETFRYGIDKIRGSPALFEPYLNNVPPAVDEWTLSEAMRADTANGGISQLENHYKTFIEPFHRYMFSHQTEKDFADIAGAGLNYVRIPLGYWAIEVHPGEPFLEKTSWTYFLNAIKWARKYGIRINLDLHSVPGSQNGWNHSGRLGTINFLNGPMGYANAQRTLDYIRILAEFISQPQYRNVVTMFGILNEPQGTTVGQDALQRFYMEAYDIIRKAGGIGENNGPFISFHDGFIPRGQWAGVFPNADRMGIDTHPYLCFGDQSSAPMSSYSNTPCTTWGGVVNKSMSAFGLTTAGEFSNAVTDCGLWLNGVNLGTRYEGTYPGSGNPVGSCASWTDWQNYDSATKTAIKTFAMASMDALQDYFFWTWKIGNSTKTGKVETPHWSYQLGLENGWMPTDPRSAIGFCQNSDPWAPPLAAWQTGGAGAGDIPASVTSALAWPPPVINNGGPIASLPAYTPTGTVVTLPVPTFTHSSGSTATATADPGSGWANTADTDGMFVAIPSCSYLDPWIGPTVAPPSPLCSSAARRRYEPREPSITPAPSR
ncbi:hypothetical protein DXG01_001052 [Tephrocybe rancida]|nr:hypothetical protein DXG01_001052 [Tephrocybe rancida]